MNMISHNASAAAIFPVLQAAGFSPAAIEGWYSAEPTGTGDLADDCRRYSAFWKLSDRLVEQLPAKPARASRQSSAAASILGRARDARERFLSRHVEAIYAHLTQHHARFMRIEDLVHAAADAFPGLTPNRAQLAAEAARLQRDKDGIEIDQGIFLSHVLAREKSGLHLCHAMLLPRAETQEQLARLSAHGVIDLGAVAVTRRGRATCLAMKNPRFLNAEDQTTIEAIELGVDVAILDPETEVAVLRGGPVEHAKYAGRVFGSGINLTHLYRGKIPYLWYLQRELGFVHKFLRGVARSDSLPDDLGGVAIEKPWIAAVDSFAIGGHCQMLLTMDYVLAADNAYLMLPARKEGIIPGLSNMRLPRFTGDRIARQLIQFGRRLDCDSPEGLLLCDEIARATEMDAAIDRAVTGLTSSGSVSAIGNRRAFRVAQEPLDLFRRCCAVYAREQAYCHFSPALIDNLEQHWGAHNKAEPGDERIGALAVYHSLGVIPGF
jgi:thioesterase DpgC